MPLGCGKAASKLSNFFWKKFKGNPPHPKGGNPWNNADIQELKSILETIPFWKTYNKSFVKDEIAFLELDTSRLEELTEAWVPVKTVYGTGVLVFDNSD